MLCLRSILYLFDNKVDLVMNFAFNQINGAFHDIMVPFIIITRYLSGHMVYLWPYMLLRWSRINNMPWVSLIIPLLYLILVHSSLVIPASTR